MIATVPPRPTAEARTDSWLLRESLDDPTFFDAVFERHFEAIFRFAATRIGPVGAEDVAAETFSIAFDRRASFDSRADSARPWLYGICVNKLHQHREAEQRWLRDAVAGVANSEVDEQSLVDARIDAQRLGPVLASALTELTPAERDVLMLHVFGDMTHAQIAGVLGIRRNAAKTRLSRGCARLRASIERAATTATPRNEETDDDRSRTA